MTWRIDFSPAALRSLENLDQQVKRRILSFVHNRLAVRPNPRQLGEALQGKQFVNTWRYRVGDYRVLAEIKDDIVTILVVEVGHRREIYR